MQISSKLEFLNSKMCYLNLKECILNGVYITVQELFKIKRGAYFELGIDKSNSRQYF